MSDNKRGVLLTVEDVMNFMAPFAGGSVPALNDEEYLQWLRWIQLGQQDAANRGFWRRLLTKAPLTITADAETTDLPDNFYKVNGIYALFVNGENWAAPNNSPGVQLFVETDPTDGSWRVRWLPTASTSSYTGELWYFYNPSVPEEASDPIILDGEMVGFYALKEYFRRLKQLGSMDDARIEYENRFIELLSLEVMPSLQEMNSLHSYNSYLNVPTNGRQFYGRRAGRSGRH
jgi:hypothetical protein